MKSKLILIFIIAFAYSCGSKYNNTSIDPIYPSKTSCLDIDNLDKYTGSLGGYITFELVLENTDTYGSTIKYTTINARLSYGIDTYCCGSTIPGALILREGNYNIGFQNGDYGALTKTDLFCVPISPFPVYKNLSLSIAPPTNYYSGYMFLTNYKRLDGYISIKTNNQVIESVYLR